MTKLTFFTARTKETDPPEYKNFRRTFYSKRTIFTISHVPSHFRARIEFPTDLIIQT